MKSIFLVISFVLSFFVADAAQYEAVIIRSGTTVSITLREKQGASYVPLTYNQDVTFEITYKDLGTIANGNSSGTFNVIVPSGTNTGSGTLNSGYSDLEVTGVDMITSAIPNPTPIITDEWAVFWHNLADNELITWLHLMDAYNNGFFLDSSTQ